LLVSDIGLYDEGIYTSPVGFGTGSIQLWSVASGKHKANIPANQFATTSDSSNYTPDFLAAIPRTINHLKQTLYETQSEDSRLNENCSLSEPVIPLLALTRSAKKCSNTCQKFPYKFKHIQPHMELWINTPQLVPVMF